MNQKRILIAFVVWVLSLLCSNSLQAQQAGDQIYFNAKILTVDDDSFTSRLGTVAEAMHVRDGKILHIGTNAQIRAMAGPSTKLVDLKGRTVMPGMMSTHEHPMDWDLEVSQILKKVFSNNEIVIRFFEGGPDKTQQEFYPVLEEAVHSAKPGQWIYFIVTSGRKYEHSVGGNSTLGLLGRYPTVVDGKRITKKTLDVAAPNNPVIVRDIFVATLLNQRAIDILKNLRFYQELTQDRGGNPPVSEETGLGASHRWAVPDLLFNDYYPQLREAYRLGLEWWAADGVTAMGSACYNPRCLQTYGDLDRRGEMPIRMMWAWNWRQSYFYQDDYFLASLVSQLNKGSDYFWNGGGWPGGERVQGEGSAGCGGSSLQIVDPALREQLQGRYAGTSSDPNHCKPNPNSIAYRYIKAGGRVATQHYSFDKDVDNLMNLIEVASKDAGFTLDQIRAKRHTFDHNGLHPRPDQIPRIKQLGMMTGGNAFEIWDTSSEALKYFGEKGVSWVVPKKTLTDGGVYSSFEIDRALGTTELTVFECCIAPMITRKAWDGKIYAPTEAISREVALKVSTRWPARYILRENVLGSLEPGKWADFLVLDRDYL
ncbi:MAG: amidohydrolase family protein, partial [Acidobacteria bacterium]|nr:amidohydrolase family protein [Acidobacteriota bacterium]